MKTNSMWMEIYFDERQRKEIEFARLYGRQFCHGTDGHNAKLIISKMADMLDTFYVAQTIETKPSEV